MLLWSAGTVAALTALYALVFPYDGKILLLHVAEVLLFLAGAWLVKRPATPDSAVPWILVLCTWGIVGGFLVENLLEPSTIGMVFLIIIFVAFGSFVFDVVALVVASVPMVIGTAFVASAEHPQDGPRWAIVAVSALLLGAMLRLLRLRLFDQLGEALAVNAALAIRDSLSGLLNRRGMDDRVPAVVAMAARRNEPLFVAVIDVDGLKEANDMYGHGFGDEVIVSVAAALRQVMREVDLIGRWGGDEFVVIGMGAAPEPEDMARRVRETIAQSTMDLSRWSAGVSIGVAFGSASDFSLDVAVHEADADMYERRRLRRTGA